MKIKELHIRNIASIEKADIDFEKGLNDGVSDNPATIFLISGDTGAGKSVILDAISLALYKNTPRIDGVAGKKKNDFRNSSGESVSVNSIEQYTRLGISDKDDCYSEVVFEGNDGKAYQAKLSLGITRNGTYSTPVWTVKADAEEFQKVDARSGEPISSAIGLTFEQFSRMAMLAQGQFATFLTGDKKERESILEQLTNTEIFSRYGEAIGNIWSKAKREKEGAESTLNTEKGHTLSSEEVGCLTQEKQDLEKEKECVEKSISAQNKVLDQVRILETANAECGKADAEKSRLEAMRTGDEYKDRKRLFTEWDRTDKERLALNNRSDAEKAKKGAEESLLKEKDLFVRLSADAVFREEDIEKQKKDLKNLADWLESRKTNDALFADAGTVCEQLRQYYGYVRELSDKNAGLEAEKGKTESLKATAKDKTKVAEAANTHADDKQKEIDELTGKRNALNPAQINEDIRTLNERKSKLDNFKTIVENVEKSKKEIENLKGRIAENEKKLGELKKTKDEKQKAFDAAKTEDDKARNLLGTMRMSVENTLKELRKKMYDEHAGTCPLCGQEIKTLHIDEDFARMLTPLQEKQKKTAETLEKAEKERNKANTDYDELNGTITTDTGNVDSKSQTVASEQKQIGSEAGKLGLDPELPLLPQIASSVEAIGKKLESLDKSQKDAEVLLKKINGCLNEKKLLDREKSDADTAKQQAGQAVTDNLNAIGRLTDDIADIRDNKIKPLGDTLSARLDAAYADWKKTDVRSELKTAANEYNGKKDKHTKDADKLKTDSDTLEKVREIQTGILNGNPGWSASADAVHYGCKDIFVEWNHLNSSISSLKDKIKDCTDKIGGADGVLNLYYEHSGFTENDLKVLVSKAGEVAGARKFVTDTDNALVNIKETIGKEVRKIADAKSELKKLLKTGSDEELAEESVPDRVSLENELEDLNCKKEELVKAIAEKQTRLETDKANVGKVQAAEKALAAAEAVYTRWDKIYGVFGGSRFRTLVQTYILRPLLNNANLYLSKITDRYTLTCSEDNEQLSILVLDRYNKNQVRSVTVLSGGERFMISLALSLALSSLNRPDMNTNILFIDEGFGTLDDKSLDSVMSTLEKLQEIAGQSNRRVGIISHREELSDRIPVKICVRKKGEGRSVVEVEHA